MPLKRNKAKVVAQAPRFDKLLPASTASSNAKRANRSNNTEQELLLRKALWKRGLRFKKNAKTLPGKPDIVFVKARVVVFCDGDFWHGNNWRKLQAKLRKGSNAEYWLKKIRMNRNRDRAINKKLLGSGWLVIRVWESEIRAECENVATEIADIVSARQQD